ncbi:putative MFS monocarboxylate transporter [Talaromyces proteolyticus]|uniref:MFS monocarboxylate transporter n=1 Tax=Talaromyces proteolyticus TaxID=1131652 RepID=A0AAD4PSY3_9EURO|nr:putative MFS monocarboxylate transporter [Talaromyces proteolyticus]KAH8689889.1 putative MFS monocarboxylate transporter [Talaromyces proteolyticus]
MNEKELTDASIPYSASSSNDHEAHVSSSSGEFTSRSILSLLGATGAVFCTVGFQNAFGVFQTYYGESFLSNESGSDIGWIGSINIFILFSGSLVTGRILDLSGPVVMFWAGSTLTVFSLMMISLCRKYWQFILAQAILLGIANACLVCPAVALIGQYFKKRRAVALGVTIAGSSLGGVIWPIVVHQLLQKPNIGFGWTMRIAGLIMLPILAVSSIIARPPILPKTMGEPLKKPAWDWTVVNTKEMLFTASGFFLIYFGMFTPFFFTTSYAIESGFSTNLAFYTVSLINGASLFGRILPGLVADRYGRFNLCIIMTVFSGIIALCWTTVTSAAGIVIFSLAYGFSSGGILSLQQACAAQIATPSNMGTAVGFVMASTSLSALAGTPVSGALIDKYGYLSVSIYSGVSMLVGSLVLVMAKLTQNSKLLAAV